MRWLRLWVVEVDVGLICWLMLWIVVGWCWSGCGQLRLMLWLGCFNVKKSVLRECPVSFWTWRICRRFSLGVLAMFFMIHEVFSGETSPGCEHLRMRHFGTLKNSRMLKLDYQIRIDSWPNSWLFFIGHVPPQKCQKILQLVWNFRLTKIIW